MREELHQLACAQAATAQEHRPGASTPISLPCCAALQSNGATRPVVRKKAALCLLRLIRKAPPDQEVMQPEAWSVKLVCWLPF